MKLAIFDLGNVLINFDLHKAFEAWASAGGISVDSVSANFNMGDAFQKYERNEISTDEYFDELGKMLGISISREEWEHGWNSLWKEPNEGVYQVIRKLAETIPVVCLSNTNISHYNVWSHRFKDKVDAFTKIYASHEIAMRKPEERAFKLIASEHKTDYRDIVFFDDLQENIEAANKLGINGVLVKNEQSVTDWAEGHFSK